jgi:hypothetical protein
MVRGARVRRPDAGADRPDPWMLIAIALGSLAVGLSVARGLTREAIDPASTAEPHAFPEVQTQPDAVPSAEDTPAASPQVSAQAPAPTAEAKARPLTVAAEAEPAPEPEHPPAAQSASAPRAPVEPPAPVVEAPAPVPATAASTPAKIVSAMTPPETTASPVARSRRPSAKVDAVPSRTPPRTPDTQSTTTPQVELGIVAYTKCDGVPQLDKRFPCPRDLRLEARVRRVINALDHCALTPAQRGQGAIRLEFERDQPVRVNVESPRRGGFDRAAVSRCTGHAFADARTSLKPDQMVVLFYFELH